MTGKEKSLVLVVSAEEGRLKSTTAELVAGGFAVEAAGSDREAEALYRDHNHALVLVDLSSPEEALRVVEKLRAADSVLPILVVSERSQPREVARAIEKGASDCLSRPFEPAKLVGRVSRWVERKGTLAEPISLEGGLREEPNFKRIIGSSDEIRDVFESIQVVTASDVPVLIQGETGTGKELVARAVHYRGPRRRFPFFPVNCAAIPETLLESELFGHERGAFTGAVERRKGKFELASGGTLFLDEIGDMPYATQSKILRAIEDRTFRRVGGSDLVRADVRIISATNKNLSQEVQAGRFREDLFYRLSVFPIYLPRLRERKKDIPELARYFLKKTMEGTGKAVAEISEAALDAMLAYPWPGNVRELDNTIKRAALLAKEDVIRPAHLGLRHVDMGAAPPPGVMDEIGRLMTLLQEGDIVQLDKIEEIFIRQALKVTAGNITEAANRLGVSRSTIYRKLQEYGLEPGQSNL